MKPNGGLFKDKFSLSDDHWYLYPTAVLRNSLFSNAARAGSLNVDGTQAKLKPEVAV